MATKSRYPRNKNNPSTYYGPHSSPPTMSATDSRHLGEPAQDMAPPMLEYPPQVLEIDPSSSTTLPNQTKSVTWNSPAFAVDGFGDASTYGASGSSRQVQVENHSRGTAQNPLLHWYIGNDGPWIPKSSISAVSEEGPARGLQDAHIQFPQGNPCSQRIPSDAGTYPFGGPASDSGYGTRRSDGGASVFSADVPDRDQDGPSFAVQLADFQQYPRMGEAVQQRDSHINDWSLLPEVAVSDNQSGKVFICQRCQKRVKTRSELKKHDLRHTKPFTCEYPGCSRIGGFSTCNDLDRHRKSKHPSAVLGLEATKRYRCHVPGCKSKEKSWPRLDNFRSHLKRVHWKGFEKEDEFEEMVQRAEYMEPMASNINQDISFDQGQSFPQTSQAAPSTARPRGPSLTSDWTGLYSEAIEPSQAHDLLERPGDSPRDTTLHEWSAPYDSPPGKTIQPSDTLQKPRQIQHDRSTIQNVSLAPVSFKEMLSDQSDRGLDSAARLSPGGNADGRHASAVDAITEAIKLALVGESVISQNNDPVPHHSPEWSLSRRKPSPGPTCQKTASHAGPGIRLGDFPSTSESFTAEAQKKAIEVLETLHRLGYIVQKDRSHSTRLFNPGSVASSKSENLLTCQKCRKFKGRPCELKKHMKRHSRPYGCTFSACNNKTFGSKNDWKRHENSQHFHLESWRCDEERPEGGVCAKVCYRKQTFTDHLQKDHSISDSNALAAKVQTCHIGRNCQARFWCGFCVRLIDLKKKSVDAWAERFDHIDDHFMGRHGLTSQSIQDWVPVDSGDKPKRGVSPLGDYHTTPSHGNSEASPPRSDSNSADESSPEPADLAGPSSGADGAYDQQGVKRKPVDDDEMGRPEKQRRRTSAEDTFVYCCQCQTSHNPKLDQNCTFCDDSHRFCDNCVGQAISS